MNLNAAIKKLIAGGALAAGIASTTTAFAQSEPTPVLATVGAPVEKPVVRAPGNGLTVTGAMGLVLNPTAQIPNPGDFRIQADYIDLGEIDNDSDALAFGPFGGFARTGEEAGDFKFYGIHGATRLGRSRLEISGGIERMRARGNRVLTGDIDGLPFGVGTTASIDLNSRVDYEDMDDTRGAIGIKYLVTRNPDPNAAHVAVGFGFNPALFGNKHFYVTATKPFTLGSRQVRTHVGARWDRFEFDNSIRTSGTLTITPILGPPTIIPFDFETEVNETSRRLSVFAGVELPIDRRGRFTFLGEIGTKNSEFDSDEDTNILADLGLPTSKFPYAAALRYGGTNGLGATVGVMRQGVLDNSQFFAQIGYGF